MNDIILPMPTNKNAFTLVEIILVMGLLFVVMSIAVVTIRPAEFFAKARDNKRLDYLTQYTTAIEEYRLDNSSYPDAESVVRTSLGLTSGQWINANLGDYMPTQYPDPLNNATYNFRYINGGNDYEFDIALEYYIDKHTEDSGNNDSRLEFGTNLNLLN